jgi:hypothetical protein
MGAQIIAIRGRSTEIHSGYRRFQADSGVR